MNLKPLSKILHLLHSLLLFNLMLGSSIPQHNHTNHCGNIRTHTPFLNSSSSLTSLLSNITLCRSQNLYFRTSLGLFQVSSIEYSGRLLTITTHSPSSCYSSSLHYVSPLAVTAGFPSPPEPNSLILFNCSTRRESISPFVQNCGDLYKCRGVTSPSSGTLEEQERYPYSCLVVEDLQKVEKAFHPKHLNCSHYSWAHRSSSSDGGNREGYKFGIRITVNIPNRVPDICKGCEKANEGNCGAGLKCLCHAKECKDKVVSEVGSIKSSGSVFLSLLSFIGTAALVMHA